MVTNAHEDFVAAGFKLHIPKYDQNKIVFIRQENAHFVSFDLRNRTYSSSHPIDVALHDAIYKQIIEFGWRDTIIQPL